MSVLLLIAGLLMFVGLVVVHEYGHFIMARRGGVDVEEFGIGFPPRAKVLTKKNGTTYTLNWLPLGGFVKLKGEHDADKFTGSYGAANVQTKIKIMLAGVVMNLLTAFVMLTFLALIGMPKLIENQFGVSRDTRTIKKEVLVGSVEPGSPADKAGLKGNDQIISVGAAGQATPLSSSTDLSAATKQLAGAQTQIIYRRGNEIKTTDAQLRSNQEVNSSQKTDSCTQQTYKSKGYLGVTPTQFTIDRNTWSAPIVAGGTIVQITKLTFVGLGHAVGGLFRGKTCEASAQVSGPVGIFVLLKDGSLLGYQFILMIIAIISLTLAIMNVLPIPALDGGRLFVTLLFKAIGKPLKQKTEDLIHGTGFAVLMVLFVLITIVDVHRFFG